MTKKDLRTGMVLTCKNGHMYLYIKDYSDVAGGVGINLNSDGGWLNFDCYNDDLTHKTTFGDDMFTVMRIDESYSVPDIRRCFTNESTHYKTIWTRPVEVEEFKVICVEQRTVETLFTVGKIYTWKKGVLINDTGFKYTTMVNGTDPDYWRLSDFYKFIKVVE